MSYDINLLDPITKKVIEINDAHFMRGGTYQMGGKSMTLISCVVELTKWVVQQSFP